MSVAMSGSMTVAIDTYVASDELLLGMSTEIRLNRPEFD